MQTTESVLEETDDMDEQFMAVARYRQQRQAIETTQATEPAEYQKLLRDSTFRPIETTGAFKGI